MSQASACKTYSNLSIYFNNYPSRSLMSDVSRAVLYSPIQMLRPQVVAEIGTFSANGGTDRGGGSGDARCRAIALNRCFTKHRQDDQFALPTKP
jgi:hypothetical protein